MSLGFVTTGIGGRGAVGSTTGMMGGVRGGIFLGVAFCDQVDGEPVVAVAGVFEGPREGEEEVDEQETLVFVVGEEVVVVEEEEGRTRVTAIK